MEYHRKFGHTLGRIQKNSLMSTIDLYYSTCCLAIQTVAPNLPSFQGIKRCVQYLASHPHKSIFYPSNSYDGSNIIRLTWRGNKVEATQYKIASNVIKIRIIPAFSIEDGQYQVLSIL